MSSGQLGVAYEQRVSVAGHGEDVGSRAACGNADNGAERTQHLLDRVERRERTVGDGDNEIAHGENSPDARGRAGEARALRHQLDPPHDARHAVDGDLRSVGTLFVAPRTPKTIGMPRRGRAKRGAGRAAELRDDSAHARQHLTKRGTGHLGDENVALPDAGELALAAHDYAAARAPADPRGVAAQARVLKPDLIGRRTGSTRRGRACRSFGPLSSSARLDLDRAGAHFLRPDEHGAERLGLLDADAGFASEPCRDRSRTETQAVGALVALRLLAGVHRQHATALIERDAVWNHLSLRQRRAQPPRRGDQHLSLRRPTRAPPAACA